MRYYCIDCLIYYREGDIPTIRADCSKCLEVTTPLEALRDAEHYQRCKKKYQKLGKLMKKVL